MEQREANDRIVQMPKPIKWVIPDFIRTDHATHLLVQQQGSEFTILFFEVQVPILTGTPEEQLAAAQKLEFAEAKCVSRIVMSVENIPLAVNNFIQALNNEGAIYPIISMLEPYMETSQELDLRMPPVSSRRAIINATDRGRAKPDLYIE